VRDPSGTHHHPDPDSREFPGILSSVEAVVSAAFEDFAGDTTASTDIEFLFEKKK